MLKFYYLPGTLGRNFEQRTLDNGNTVTSTSIAISHGYYPYDDDGERGEWVEKTIWMQVQTWNKRMGDTLMKHFHKGDGILLQTGFPKARGYADKNTGDIKASLSAKIEAWSFLPGRKQAADDRQSDYDAHDENPGPAPTDGYDYAPQPKDPDDIPF